MACSIYTNQHLGYLIQVLNIYTLIGYCMTGFDSECLRKLQPNIHMYGSLNTIINDLPCIIHLDLNNYLELLIKGNTYKNTYIIY